MGSDPELDDAARSAPCCARFCETHGIDYACAPGTTHLLKLEEPEQCFALLDGFLAANGVTG